MKQIEPHSDSRMTLACVYCGGPPETGDHVPSKVLLDEPFPENLPKVYACLECNQSFSLDEEYLACFLEAVLVGSTKSTSVMRSRVQRILTQRPSLAARIANSSVADEHSLNWMPELERLEKVIWKLAQGHAAYDLSLPLLGVPDHLGFAPLVSLSEVETMAFEQMPERMLWPEVGSRAMIRMAESLQKPYDPWRIVQSGRYRYALSTGPGVIVKIVMSEYLACEVIWNY